MIDQLLDFTRIRLGRGLPLTRGPRRSGGALPRGRRRARGDRGAQRASASSRRGSWSANGMGTASPSWCRTCSATRSRTAPGAADLAPRRRPRPGAVVLEVHSGGAIPADIVPVIFEPFRGHRATASTSGSSGLGLGLYISQQIAARARRHDRRHLDRRRGHALHGPPDPQRDALAEPAFRASIGERRSAVARQSSSSTTRRTSATSIARRADREGYVVFSARTAPGAGDDALAAAPVRRHARHHHAGDERRRGLRAMQADPALADIPVVVWTSDPSRRRAACPS